MDTWPGMQFEPLSLHKYLYANANPILNIDPSGYFSVIDSLQTLNTISNLYTIASISFNLLSGNYVGAGKEIAEELIWGKLGHFQKIANLGKKGRVLFGKIYTRVFSTAKRLKLGRARSSSALRHNMQLLLGNAPPNHQAHHIIAGAYNEGKQATKIIEAAGIDVNSVANGVFLPNPTAAQGGVISTIHWGKHSRAYEEYVLDRLRQLGSSPAAENVINVLHDIRMELLSGALSLNKW